MLQQLSYEPNIPSNLSSTEMTEPSPNTSLMPNLQTELADKDVSQSLNSTSVEDMGSVTQYRNLALGVEFCHESDATDTIAVTAASDTPIYETQVLNEPFAFQVCFPSNQTNFQRYSIVIIAHRKMNYSPNQWKTLKSGRLQISEEQHNSNWFEIKWLMPRVACLDALNVDVNLNARANWILTYEPTVPSHTYAPFATNLSPPIKL